MYMYTRSGHKVGELSELHLNKHQGEYRDALIS